MPKRKLDPHRGDPSPKNPTSLQSRGWRRRSDLKPDETLLKAEIRIEELEDKSLRLEHIVVSAYNCLLQCGGALPLHGITALNLLKVMRPEQLGEIEEVSECTSTCQHGYYLVEHCDSCGRDCWGNPTP